MERPSNNISKVFGIQIEYFGKFINRSVSCTEYHDPCDKRACIFKNLRTTIYYFFCSFPVTHHFSYGWLNYSGYLVFDLYDALSDRQGHYGRMEGARGGPDAAPVLLRLHLRVSGRTDLANKLSTSKPLAPSSPARRLSWVQTVQCFDIFII